MRVRSRPPPAFYSLLLSSELIREMRDISSGEKTRERNAPVLSQRNRAPQFSTCAPKVHVRTRVCAFSCTMQHRALLRSPRFTCARVCVAPSRVQTGSKLRGFRSTCAIRETPRARVCAWERVCATRRDCVPRSLPWILYLEEKIWWKRNIAHIYFFHILYL